MVSALPGAKRLCPGPCSATLPEKPCTEGLTQALTQ